MRPKDLKIHPIDYKVAKSFVIKNHYSKKTAVGSQINFGAFYGNYLVGVLQFGPPISNLNACNIYMCKMRELIELNRMVFVDEAPKNSESRCLAVSIKLIKKHYTHVKVIQTFADACQCGDGTIYRACGFSLIAINKNDKIVIDENGKTLHKNLTMYHKPTFKEEIKSMKVLEGNMIKYAYFIDKKLEANVKTLEYSEIVKKNASMYKGMRGEHEVNASGKQPEESGLIPTTTLQKDLKI